MAAIRDDNNRVREWEAGLPSAAELTPLSKTLISRVLARAFCIPPSSAPANTPEDVDRATKSTLQLLRRKASSPAFALPSSIDPYSPSSGGRATGAQEKGAADEEAAAGVGRGAEARAVRRGTYPKGGGGWQGEDGQEREEEACGIVGAGGGRGNAGVPEFGQAGYWPAQGVMSAGPGGADQGRQGGLEAGSESTKGASVQQKSRKMLGDAESEDVDSADGPDGSAARTLKRPRLVWTPQLHKRFVDAVGHLGLKNAVPKTIMQLMNVEGLTRENVASHLQKYRLYLKRMQGLCTDGPSASDPLFASAPLPMNLAPQHFLPNPHHSRAAENGSSGTFSPPAVPGPRAQGMFPTDAMRGAPMGHGAAAAAAAMQHFGGYEHQSHNFGIPRTIPQRPANMHRDLLVNAHPGQQAQPQAPPSHRVLTLFPQS